MCDIQDTAQEIPTFYNDLGHIGSVEPVCELLNKLNDENEQLRGINKELGDDLYNCRLKKEELSEDIHKWATDGRYVLMFDEHTFFVFDNEKEERMTALETTKRLNKQQANIQSLKERLYDFEKRKIIEESEIDEDVIPKVKLLRSELFGEKYE